jgi:hypothetical protein
MRGEKPDRETWAGDNQVGLSTTFRGDSGEASKRFGLEVKIREYAMPRQYRMAR